MNDYQNKMSSKYGEYFHLQLLKYYNNFINFYKQKENLPTDYLHFDFKEDGLYIINYKELQDKAYEEYKLLKLKTGQSDTGNDSYLI